jgi:mannose-6-phosphate isomerase-like protein (cupin superfamily)
MTLAVLITLQEAHNSPFCQAMDTISLSDTRVNIMKNFGMLAVVLLALPLCGADPDGFGMWSGSDMKARANAAKLDEHKAGLDRVANWGNHALLSIRREGDGEAEVHETQVDVIFITSGEGTLVVGGTMVGGHPTTTGEVRGTSITGGVSKKMIPGDVFHIPAKMPHQMLVPKMVTFAVVKVETK